MIKYNVPSNKQVVRNMYDEIQHVTGYVLDDGDELADLKGAKHIFDNGMTSLVMYSKYSDGNAFDYQIAPTGSLEEDAYYHKENDPGEEDNMKDAEAVEKDCEKDINRYLTFETKHFSKSPDIGFGFNIYDFPKMRHAPVASDVLRIFLTNIKKSDLTNAQIKHLRAYAKQQDAAYADHRSVKPNPYRELGKKRLDIETNISYQKIIKHDSAKNKRHLTKLVDDYKNYKNSLNNK